jgi:hypothetical protein
MPLEERLMCYPKSYRRDEAVRKDIEAELSRGAPVQHRFRIFLANLAVALGWALKRSCKGCAHRLFTTARWLVPEAQRFLVYRYGVDNHPWRMRTLLSHRRTNTVAAGFLIVLVLLGSLDLTRRATAISTQPALGSSAFQHESLGESSETMQEFNSQPALVSGTQNERVPLSTRKAQSAYKVPTKKGVNAATQRKMAQQKSARKRMR